MVQALAALVEAQPRVPFWDPEVPLAWLPLGPPPDLAAIAGASTGRQPATLGSWEVSVAGAEESLTGAACSAPGSQCVHLASDGGDLSLLAAWAAGDHCCEVWLVLPEDGLLEPVGDVETWLRELLAGRDVPPGSCSDHLADYPGMIPELRAHLHRLVAEAGQRLLHIERAIESDEASDGQYAEWERLEALIAADPAD